MSSRASGGALAACLITAAIVGFAGGGYFGSQSGDGGSPSTAETAAPDDTTPVGETPADGETPAETETPAGETGITLTAAQSSVAPDQQIDLTGTLTPPEEGVVLLVQRSVDGGEWEPFPEPGEEVQATTNADGTFSTYVTTGRSGTNSFRLVRADDDSVVSNEVQVAVG